LDHAVATVNKEGGYSLRQDSMATEFGRMSLQVVTESNCCIVG